MQTHTTPTHGCPTPPNYSATTRSGPNALGFMCNTCQQDAPQPVENNVKELEATMKEAPDLVLGAAGKAQNLKKYSFYQFQIIGTFAHTPPLRKWSMKGVSPPKCSCQPVFSHMPACFVWLVTHSVDGKCDRHYSDTRRHSDLFSYRDSEVMDISSMTVAELRAELKKRGLDHIGEKAALQMRLLCAELIRRGLDTTGEKAELQARLQKAIYGTPCNCKASTGWGGATSWARPYENKWFNHHDFIRILEIGKIHTRQRKTKQLTASNLPVCRL